MLAITDLNRVCLDDEGSLRVVRLGRGYAWLEAGEFVRAIEKRTGQKVTRCRPCTPPLAPDPPVTIHRIAVVIRASRSRPGIAVAKLRYLVAVACDGTVVLGAPDTHSLRRRGYS